MRADMDIRGALKMPGAIAYETDAAPDAIRKIKYFKNSFVVLDEQSAANLEELAARANVKNIKAPPLARSFGLVFSDANELKSADGAVKARLIDRIQKQTGLAYRSGLADVEFWLMLRSDKAGYLLQRITKTHRQVLAAGELEAHVAIMLARASDPKPGQIFIDPFAGRGAIPLARAKIAKYRGIFAMDDDSGAINALRSKVRAIRNGRIQKSFFVKKGDFFKNAFHKYYADAIATDPPWGLYRKVDDNFYAAMMTEFGRLMKPGGRLVVLVAREIDLPPSPRLCFVESFPVLIHGEKATVHIFVATERA